MEFYGTIKINCNSSDNKDNYKPKADSERGKTKVHSVGTHETKGMMLGYTLLIVNYEENEEMTNLQAG